jgi:hypothetical protein
MSLPFRTVGMPYTDATYQESPTDAGISTALQAALDDQNIYFFLIWVLYFSPTESAVSSTAYQVNSTLTILYNNAHIWGTGQGGTAHQGSTTLQPITGLTGDMISWGGTGDPDAIDIRWLQFDGGNLPGTNLASSIGPSSGSATSSTSYSSTATTIVVNAGGTLPTSSGYYILIISTGEVIYVSLVSGTTLTETRGALGTTKVIIASGATLQSATFVAPASQIYVITDPSSNIDTNSKSQILYYPIYTSGASRIVTYGYNTAQGPLPPPGTNTGKAVSFFMNQNDLLFFSYASTSGITLTEGTLHSYLNLSASVDTTHPIYLHSVTCTSNGAVVFPIYVSLCQEAYFDHVYVNNNPTSGSGLLYFASGGGNCWFQNCNLSGLMAAATEVHFGGGNIGANGLWIYEGVNTNFKSNTTIVDLDNVNFTGPVAGPNIQFDNPNKQMWLVMTGGTLNGAGNFVDGLISGQNPAKVNIEFLGTKIWNVSDIGGGSGNAIPLHATSTGLARGSCFNPDSTSHITLSQLMINTQFDGVFIDSSYTHHWSTILGQSAMSTFGGTTNASTLGPVANGSSFFLTPSRTGKVRFTFDCDLSNNVAGDGASIQAFYGTGSSPVAGASISVGTAVGNKRTLTSVVAANDSSPASLSVLIIWLTIGTIYWFDAGLLAVTGGTAKTANPNATVEELIN